MFLSPRLNLKFLLKTPFSLGIFSFFQLATVLGHFSTVPQLLPVLGRASGSHAGHRDSQAVLTIIGNLTPILGAVNVKRSFWAFLRENARECSVGKQLWATGALTPLQFNCWNDTSVSLLLTFDYKIEVFPSVCFNFFFFSMHHRFEQSWSLPSCICSWGRDSSEAGGHSRGLGVSKWLKGGLVQELPNCCWTPQSSWKKHLHALSCVKHLCTWLLLCQKTWNGWTPAQNWDAD